MDAPQQTIANPVSLEGLGLFAGNPVEVTFKPAPANHGVVFVRTDCDNTHIPAHVSNVVKRARRTSLQVGDVVIDTCEHCLSAVAAMLKEKLLIEVNGPELPGLDGSAKPFLDALQEAGVVPLDQPRRVFTIEKPVMIRHDGAMIAALPADGPTMEVVYDLDYGGCASIGRQLRNFDMSNGNYAHDIAPARTFLLEEEARQAQAAGIGRHLTEKDILVVGPTGPLGDNAFRFPDEPVRHKIVDVIGDLYLLGAPIRGRIVAYKSGHALNHALVRALLDQYRHQQRQEALSGNAMDIKGLMRMLPHRYPMLLVDRVVEIDGARRAVGIKNVSINEPFFTGHYPGSPIMPGVLIVEAMAQLSGVVIAQTLEHKGKLAVLLSLDRVKLRKPVTPGDQLVLEAEVVRIRPRIAHTRCRAYVGEELAAEAEVKFMLVDDDDQA